MAKARKLKIGGVTENVALTDISGILQSTEDLTNVSGLLSKS
jgi:hypothetical protein